MKTINDWFHEYEASHKHPINCLIHIVAVPAIMLSALGLLWSLPFPNFAHPLMNWASVVVCGVLIFAMRLSWRLALGLSVATSINLLLLWWLSVLTSHFTFLMGALFSVAWIFQFFGHHIEGKKPSFIHDLHFLVISPMWLIAKLYRKANISW